jgi:hypothetical protein
LQRRLSISSALAIDNDFCWARLYLASSFGAEYVPHVDSADNLAMAKQALEHYEAAMKCDPSLRTTSLIGMSYLTMLMEKYQKPATSIASSSI